MQCMRFVGWHDDHITAFQLKRLARDSDIRLAIQNVNQSIERRGMLTQFLSFIEGKECDIARILFGDLPADDRAFLLGSQVSHV